MKKKIKFTKKYFWFLVIIACALWYAWYTHPKHIEDNLIVFHQDTGESHTITLDIYVKKSLVRVNVYYGSVWVDNVEYANFYEESSLWQIGQKVKDFFHSSSTDYYGTYAIKESKSMVFSKENFIIIWDYKPKKNYINIFLAGQKHPFTEGTYTTKSIENL